MEKEILEILKSMQSDIKSMKYDIKELKEDNKEIKVQLNENTQILKALEHSAQVNKAEHDNMSNDIIHVKGTVEAINKNLCRVEEATAHNWMDIAKLKAVK